MSRNKREGKYAGKMKSKHYRTRGVNCRVSALDCYLELQIKELRQARKITQQLLSNGALGSFGKILMRYI